MFPGKKMSGHMGASGAADHQRLQVVKVDAERGLIAIRGAVPGPGGDVIVRPSSKAKETMTMELAINITNGKTLSVSTPSSAVKFSEDLVHQVVVAYRNAGRAPAPRRRRPVRKSTAPPRSRRSRRAAAPAVGALTAPIFVGGGVTFAAKPRSFEQKVNRKMYRAAIAAILSER